MKQALLAIFTSLALTGNAQTEFTVGDFTFTKTSPTTVEVSGYKGTNTAIEIPESVNYLNDVCQVTAIGEDAFSWSRVATVTLPASIDSIKDKAFKSSDLASITIPEGVTYIGKYAFFYCI